MNTIMNYMFFSNCFQKRLESCTVSLRTMFVLLEAGPDTSAAVVQTRLSRLQEKKTNFLSRL